RSGHAGDRTHPLQDLPLDLPRPPLLHVPGGHPPELHDEHAVWSEPQLDPLEPVEARDEQPRPGEEHHGQPRLPGRGRRPPPASPDPAGTPQTATTTTPSGSNPSSTRWSR